jgi:hypothetical protein
MTSSLSYLLKHIDNCPLVLRENKLIRHKNTTDAHIAIWFGQLKALTKQIKVVELDLLDIRERKQKDLARTL